jgi:SAM-dependent methyltransferase
MNRRSLPDDWDQHWRAVSTAMRLNPAVAYRWRTLLRMMHTAVPLGTRGTLLDIGCGNGELTCLIAEAFGTFDVLGLDASATAVDVARARCPRASFRQVDLNSNAGELLDLQGWATHAVCSEVLEHLDDPVAALQNVRSLVRPGGRLFITLPAGPMSSFDRYLGHRKHYGALSLTSELQAAGWKPERIWRAGFPFHTLYRLVLVSRRQSLLRDALAVRESDISPITRLAMKGFNVLFRANVNDAPLGWQLVAEARAV